MIKHLWRIEKPHPSSKRSNVLGSILETYTSSSTPSAWRFLSKSIGRRSIRHIIWCWREWHLHLQTTRFQRLGMDLQQEDLPKQSYSSPSLTALRINIFIFNLQFALFQSFVSLLPFVHFTNLLNLTYLLAFIPFRTFLPCIFNVSTSVPIHDSLICFQFWKTVIYFQFALLLARFTCKVIQFYFFRWEWSQGGCFKTTLFSISASFKFSISAFQFDES